MNRMLSVLMIAAAASVAEASATTEAAASMGITPEACAIAGLTPTQVTEVLSTLLANDAQVTFLAELESQRGSLEADLDSLKSALAGGDSDANSGSDMFALENTISLLDAQIESAWTNLYSGAVETLPISATTRLEAYRLSRRFKVEPAMRAIPRTAADWMLIESSLRREAIALARGDEVDPQDVALLAAIRQTPITIEAESLLAANLPALRGIFLSYH